MMAKLTAQALQRSLEYLERLPRTPEGDHVTDEEAVDYALQILAPADVARIDRHLATCAACCEDMLLTLEDEDEAAAATLAVKATDHPPDHLLFCFSIGAIPTPQGNALRDAIAGHLASCARCGNVVATIMRIDLQQAVANVVAVQRLLDGLRLMALRRAAAMKTAFGSVPGAGGGPPPKGTVRGADDEVAALVVDDTGQLAVDSLGQAEVVRFAVLKAAIRADGVLDVQLLTSEEPYCRSTSEWDVQVSLHHEGIRLQLPAAPLICVSTSVYPSAVASVRHSLPINVEVGAIPPESLEVVVSPARR